MLTVGGSHEGPVGSPAPDPGADGRVTTPVPRPATWRFAFGGTLALAMGVGPLAVYVLSALAPAITEELALSRTQLGTLATVSYLVTASLSVTTGDVIDRVTTRAALFTLFLVGGASLAGIGVAPGYGTLMFAVALSGLTQALSNPVTNQTIATLLPPGERGLIMGVKQSGVQMCQFIAGATLPLLAVGLGWRGATLTMPVIALAGLVLVLLVIPRAPAPASGAKRTAGGARVPLPPSVWWLAAYSFLIGACLQATNVYVPLFAFEEVGFGAVLAGATTGVLGGVGVLSRMGWGRLAERISPPQLPLAYLAVGGTVAATLLFLSPQVPAFVWAGVVAHALTAVAANVVAAMAIVRIVEVPQLGRASGVLALGLYLGFAVGPVAFGALADRTGSFGPGWLVLVGVYVTAAVLTRLWDRQERRRKVPA